MEEDERIEEDGRGGERMRGRKRTEEDGRGLKRRGED